MCFSQPKAAPPPAAPPPPPPTLDQSAPEVAAPKTADSLNRRAMGTKQYRSSLSIGAPTSSNTVSNNSGLGITM